MNHTFEIGDLVLLNMLPSGEVVAGGREILRGTVAVRLESGLLVVRLKDGNRVHVLPELVGIRLVDAVTLLGEVGDL